MPFLIEYRSDVDVFASTSHPGPLEKAKMEATIGLLRHLTSGVEDARILDTNGHEILNMPIPAVIEK